MHKHSIKHKKNSLETLWHKIYGNISLISKRKKPQLTDFCLWNEAVLHYLDSRQ